MLEQYLENCSENASYISKTSQKDLISCWGQLITEFVVKNIGAAVSSYKIMLTWIISQGKNSWAICIMAWDFEAKY